MPEPEDHFDSYTAPPPPRGGTPAPPPPAAESPSPPSPASPEVEPEPVVLGTASYDAPVEEDDDESLESLAAEWDPVVVGSEDDDRGSRPLRARGTRRPWRTRALDWAIGAAAMLLVLTAAAWIAWLSLTRPADDGAREAPTSPPASADPSPTPPADLAEGEVWIGDVDFSSGSIVAADTPLLDLEATGTDVVSGPEGLRAGYLDVTATVPFDVVAEELEPGSVVEPAGNGEARIETVVDVLGRNLDVVAVGTVDVVDGSLVIEPSDLELGGTGFFSELLGDLVRGLITVRYDIDGLPEGLVLQSVEVTDDGFRAHLVGEDVQLSG